ncbi:hypothetical protein AXF42_Ash016652 [Apostasia shenzhenica]|uniref:Uncharacterized protein n=1 Tax=Apostasia shenzhenica TaxID=1088818 RepID=A0A2I0A1P9_9ASPA|nr:hypothetical protein AXF42_Ash016652 [Apostasia shenzhenica]
MGRHWELRRDQHQEWIAIQFGELVTCSWQAAEVLTNEDWLVYAYKYCGLLIMRALKRNPQKSSEIRVL